MKRLLYFILLLGILPGFAQKHESTVDSKLTKVWESKPGLLVPESVLYDQKSGLLYISNINGNSTEKDGNGFISVLNLKGEFVNKEWITGLDAPKGMGIWNRHLFVTNITEVVEIDQENGKILKRYMPENASFLNDIAIDQKGNVYITDTKAACVFKISNGKAGVWKSGDDFQGTNGLFYKNNFLYVGTKNGILKINLESNAVEKAVDNSGSIDGLYLSTSNKFIFSDWTGHVYTAEPGKKPELLLDITPDKMNAADFGVVPEKNLIIIPTFLDNRVVCFSCPIIK